MAKRADILARLPVVFGLSEAEAAACIGVSAAMFHVLVGRNLMPKPRQIGTRRVYDIDELRAAFKALPHDGEAAPVNEWDEAV